MRNAARAIDLAAAPKPFRAGSVATVSFGDGNVLNEQALQECSAFRRGPTALPTGTSVLPAALVA
jgi:hypothetical protein